MSLLHIAIYLAILAIFLLPIVAIIAGIRWLVKFRKHKPSEEK